jgi:hypothetical protein
MQDPLRLAYGKQLHPRFSAVIQKLHDLFGDTLCIKSLSSTETTFRVDGLTAEVTIRTLMEKQAEVFGLESGAGGGCVLGPADFQILCPLNATFAPELTIRHFPTLAERSEYRTGFWYY